MPSERFLVVDVETANANYASICQIGIVEVIDGQIVNEWSSLVDPEDEFDGFNVSIHGIEPDHVRGAPTFPIAWTQISERMASVSVLSYTWFDRSAIWQAHEKYGLPEPTCDWHDATRIVRRTWSDMAYGGYKLKNVAKKLKIEMQRHHDALSDARAAALIVIEAMQQSGQPISEWVKLAYKPMTPKLRPSDVMASIDESEKDENGPLGGELVVFTGELSVPRRDAMARAIKAGAEVRDTPTAKMTILVVGVQDANKMNGYEKSTKHRKAEELIAQGHEIQIMTERNFFDALSKMR